VAIAIGKIKGNYMMKTRKANRQGCTYKRGSSYRTVIKIDGKCITATAKTREDSRRLAKERLSVFEKEQASAKPLVSRSLSTYILNWLESDHKHYLAPTTYRRYKSIVINHINPNIGHLDLSQVTAREVNALLIKMREDSLRRVAKSLIDNNFLQISIISIQSRVSFCYEFRDSGATLAKAT
jgi:Phage integrase, N-terminal SAM-like domain